MSKAAAYGHRRRSPAFARRWQEAVEEAAVRLRFGLVEHAGNMLSTTELPPAICGAAIPVRD